MFDDIIGSADLAFGGASDIIGAQGPLDALFSGSPLVVTGAHGRGQGPRYVVTGQAAMPLQTALAASAPNALSFANQMAATQQGQSDAASQIAQQAIAQQLAARHAAMVVPRQATKAREYPLGFPTTTVKAGTSTTISAQPQVPFRGRRLVIPSDIAGSILINDIKVGKNSMFPTSNPVPGRTFTELGVGVDLNLDTAQISQLVSLSISNTSLADITFNAALIGTAVE